MSKLALVLCGFALAILLAVGAVFLPLQLSGRLVLFGVAGGLSIGATLVLLGATINRAALPDGIEEVIDNLAEEVEDDITALKQGRLTATHVMFLITGVLVVIFSALITDYRKITAMWGPVPVVVPAVLGAGLVAFILSRIDWFYRRTFRTPFWIFLIPVVGIILAMGLGIYMTEPIEFGGSSQYEVSQRYDEDYSYDYGHTRFYYWYASSYLDTGTSGDVGFEMPDIDIDDDSAEGMAILILIVVVIVITVILVVGAAFIPHFWLVSGIVFLAMLAMIALREVRVRPYRRREAWW